MTQQYNTASGTSLQFGDRSLNTKTKLVQQSDLEVLGINIPVNPYQDKIQASISYLIKSTGQVVDYRCNNLLTVNTKLSDTNEEMNTKVMTFNLPALTDSEGFKVCKSAGQCSKGCYAMIANWSYLSTIATNDIKLHIARDMQAWFIKRIQYEIDKHKPTHIRIHSSGDFFSRQYFMAWCKIIRSNKGIIFYAYTKEHRLMKQLSNLKNVIPDNFIYILSEGSKNDCIKPTDRQARVFKTEDDIPNNFVNASHNDLKAIESNHLIGLAYH